MNAASAILLSIASACALITAFGVVLSADVYRRLHFLGPTATIGVVCVTAAIVVQEGLDQAGIKTILTGVVLFFMNPVVTHITARTARIHQRGRWQEDERP